MSLTAEQFAGIKRQLGANVNVLCSAVAKLHLASPVPRAVSFVSPDSILFQFPNLTDSHWTDADVAGALVLIADSVQNSLLFQIYNIDQPEMMLFEYELYENIEYKRLNDTFYVFEMEDCMAGFAFADAQAALAFFGKVQTVKPRAAELRESKKAPAAAGNKKGMLGGMFRGKGRKNKLDIGEIGEVYHVEHKGHIGMSKTGEFDVRNIPEDWKKIFKQAGIKKKDLKDAETAQEIFRTIQNEEMNTYYKKQDQYKNIQDQQLQEMYTPSQRLKFEKYQEEMRQYQQQLDERKAHMDHMHSYEYDTEENLVPYTEDRTSYAQMNASKQKNTVIADVGVSAAPEKKSQNVPRGSLSQFYGNPNVHKNTDNYDRVRGSFSTSMAGQNVSGQRVSRGNSKKQLDGEQAAIAKTGSKGSKSPPPVPPPRKKGNRGSKRSKESKVPKDSENLPLPAAGKKNKVDAAAAEALRVSKLAPPEVINEIPIDFDIPPPPADPEVEEQEVQDMFASAEPVVAPRQPQASKAAPVMPPRKVSKNVAVAQQPIQTPSAVKDSQLGRKSTAPSMQKSSDSGGRPSMSSTKGDDNKKQRKGSGFSFLKTLSRKSNGKKKELEEVGAARPVIVKDQKEIEKKKSEPQVQVVEKVVEVVRYEKSEELQEMERNMKKALAEAEAARQQAIALQEEHLQLKKMMEDNELKTKQKNELYEMELQQYRLRAQELEEAKKFEEAEKLALAAAKAEADKAREELMAQKAVTEKEKAEALKKYEETQRKVMETEKKVADTETKLKLAEERAKKLPPPPPKIPVIPVLPPLAVPQIPKLPPLPPPAPANIPSSPPLPPMPPVGSVPVSPAPKLPSAPQNKPEKPTADNGNSKPDNKPAVPALTPVVKKPALPTLNAGLLAGIKEGVKLTHVKQSSMNVRSGAKKGNVIRPKANALANSKNVSARLQRFSVKNPQAAQQLMASLAETIKQRRMKMAGQTSPEDNDSDSDWSV